MVRCTLKYFVTKTVREYYTVMINVIDLLFKNQPNLPFFFGPGILCAFLL